MLLNQLNSLMENIKVKRFRIVQKTFFHIFTLNN